jgi:membrane protein
VLFLFPLLVFIVASLVATGWFTLIVAPIVNFLPSFLPEASRLLVLDYINSTAARNPTHLMVASFIMMLWTGWGLMSTYIEGVNRAYGLSEERTILKDQIAAIQLLVFASLPLLALGAIALAGTRLEHWVEFREHIQIPILWKFVRWCTVLAALMGVNTVIYYFGVHRRQTLRDVLPGAMLATGIWLVASLAFETYVLNFGRFDLIYGGLGAVIVLLAFMYLSALAVLLGGEFNAVLLLAREQGR